MPKKRGNPDWCKPVPIGTLVASPSSFESLTEALRLAPGGFPDFHSSQRMGEQEQEL